MINKYEAGQVVDIRFSNDSMPDRIFIDMVYKKPNSTMYCQRRKMDIPT